MNTRPLLRSLRNDLPMPFTFRQLGNEAPYAKTVEGRFRFVCPHCGVLNAVLNPKNNLAHCFACGTNTNNIDLLLALGYDFRKAIETLQRFLRSYRERGGTKDGHGLDDRRDRGPGPPSPSPSNPHFDKLRASTSLQPSNGPRPLRESLALELQRLAVECARPAGKATTRNR